MRSKTSNWFECKVRYDQTQSDGADKKVTEKYVVEAIGFSDAEQRIAMEMSKYVTGEFDIIDIKPTPYKTVLSIDGESDNCDGDPAWYKTKVQFIIFDEKLEREKKSNVTYLVQAASIRNALDNLDLEMKDSMADYVQANIGETQIIDVFENATVQAADLIAKMAEELKDESLSVESIVDKYVTTATQELRRDFINELNKIRNN